MQLAHDAPGYEDWKGSGRAHPLYEATRLQKGTKIHFHVGTMGHV
jgi:hypothetical protein